MASAQTDTAVNGTTGAAANGTDGTSSTSPCINSEDGSIELVCTVVVGVGIVVALITVCCIFHIIKLCVKLKNDPVGSKHADRRMGRLFLTKCVFHLHST